MGEGEREALGMGIVQVMCSHTSLNQDSSMFFNEVNLNVAYPHNGGERANLLDLYRENLLKCVYDSASFLFEND